MAQKDKSSKAGRNQSKCAEYRARESRGQTAKCRRVFRALKRGVDQPGWKISQVYTDRAVKA